MYMHAYTCMQLSCMYATLHHNQHQTIGLSPNVQPISISIVLKLGIDVKRPGYRETEDKDFIVLTWLAVKHNN